MKLVNILTLIIISIFVISACKKNSQSLLVLNKLVGNWRFSSYKVKGVTATISECRKQSIVQFNSNGTFLRLDYEIYNSICKQIENVNGTYNYNSSENSATLHFTDPADGAQTEKWNNLQITSSTLSFTWDENLDGVDELNVTYAK